MQNCTSILGCHSSHRGKKYQKLFVIKPNTQGYSKHPILLTDSDNDYILYEIKLR